ncbi:MAG: hypothetical protein KDA87_12730 [Planctomycetales bacterium]|nr:hypothetical protein [Planctomycetales bacterium]
MMTQNGQQPARNDRQWYVRRFNSQTGPVSTKRLVHAARQGRLRPTDEISADGQKWRKASRYRLPFSERVKKQCKPTVLRPNHVTPNHSQPVPPPPPIAAPPVFVAPPQVRVLAPSKPFAPVRTNMEDARPEKRQAELKLTVSKRNFIGTTDVPMTLSDDEMRITLPDNQHVTVPRDVESIASRLTFRKLERTTAMTVLVLLGPIGWIILVYLLINGMKSRLQIDKKLFLVSPGAAEAIEIWGGLGWERAKIRNHAKRFGWAVVLWGVINAFNAITTLAYPTLELAIPVNDLQWLYPFVVVESGVAFIVGIAMVAVGAVGIGRRDDQSIKLYAIVFFTLAGLNAIDGALLAYFVNGIGVQLASTVHGQFVAGIVVCGVLSLIQVAIGSSQVELVRKYHQARRRHNPNQFAQYLHQLNVCQNSNSQSNGLVVPPGEAPIAECTTSESVDTGTRSIAIEPTRLTH